MNLAIADLLAEQKVVSERDVFRALGMTNQTKSWPQMISAAITILRAELKEHGIDLPRRKSNVGWSLGVAERAIVAAAGRLTGNRGGLTLESTLTMDILKSFDDDFAALFRRRDVVFKHQPKCPACRSEQVQIMSEAKPAQWRCRMCKHKFESEPE